MAANDSGADKSEQPTHRRKEKAREEGNVPKSKELSSAFIILAGAMTLYGYGPYMARNIGKYFTETYQFQNIILNQNSLLHVVQGTLKFFYITIFPVFIILFIVAIMGNVIQTGPVYSPKAIMPKLEKISPLKGFKRIFSKRSVVELVKSLFKIFVVGTVIFLTVKKEVGIILRLGDADPIDTITFFSSLALEISIKVGIIILVLALLDFLYQKWQHNEDLKMTKQEVKEEFKQMEGDLIKQKIRNLQLEQARNRMMEDIPDSDVVVTNPIHYAVAIKYDASISSAPVVTAKGQRLLALKIKELATMHNIPVVEDPPLAQALFKTVDIGEEIPENLYKAVAAILAYIYKQRNRTVQ